MTPKRSDRLLQQIEAGALDSRTPIAEVLLKVIALGGRAGSAELRDWAHRELRGYEPTDDLPSYRQVVAPLQMDAGTMQGFIKNQSLSPWELPEVARDKITNDLPLAMGIAEIERLVRNCKPGDVVKLGPPGSQEVVVLMNASGQWRGHIERIYWSVSPVVWRVWSSRFVRRSWCWFRRSTPTCPTAPSRHPPRSPLMR